MRINRGSIIGKLVRENRPDFPMTKIIRGVTALEFAYNHESEAEITVMLICNTAGVFPRAGIHPRLSLVNARFQKWFHEKEEAGVSFELGNFIVFKERRIRIVLAILEKGLRSRIRPRTLDSKLCEQSFREVSSLGDVYLQREDQTDEEWKLVRSMADYFGKGNFVLFE
jgi:hypothetical protein